jgi:hypothetical protein
MWIQKIRFDGSRGTDPYSVGGHVESIWRVFLHWHLYSLTSPKRDPLTADRLTTVPTDHGQEHGPTADGRNSPETRARHSVELQ